MTLALFIGTAVVCFGLGWRQHGLEDAREQASNLARMANARQKRDEETARLSDALEAQLAGYRTANRDLTRRLHAEIQKPDYRCLLPNDGMQLRTDALAGHPAE